MSVMKFSKLLLNTYLILTPRSKRKFSTKAKYYTSINMSSNKAAVNTSNSLPAKASNTEHVSIQHLAAAKAWDLQRMIFYGCFLIEIFYFSYRANKSFMCLSSLTVLNLNFTLLFSFQFTSLIPA